MPTLFVIASAVIYGIAPSLMKVTYAYGGSGMLSTFYTCLLALPILYFSVRSSSLSLRLSRTDARHVLLLLLGACPTSLLLYSSYSYLPVGLSTTLHFIFPLVMAVYLRIFYRERLKKNQVFCLVLTLLGLAMASSSSFGGGSFPGIVLAVASGFTWAFYMVYIQKSGLTALPPAVLNFYLCLGNLVTSGLFCLATGNLVLYSANWVWSVVLVTALLQRILANILYQLGMRHISPLSTGILSTFEPLTSILFGALYLKEHLLPFQLAGAFLILCAICVNVLSEHFPVFRKAAAQTEKSFPVKKST